MLKPIKGLGQNFIIESGVASNMVNALGMEKNDLVVEIGAGLGALTKILVKEAKKKKTKVQAIEIDERYVKELKKRFSMQKNLTVFKADVLSWLPRFRPGKEFKVIGSLPYYITSPILHAVARHKGNISICVLLMQKEVGRKISAKAPKASYLSVYLQTFYKIKVLEIIPRSFFEPIPKVDGVIVRMTKIKNPPIAENELMNYEEFLHKAFSKPRKMLNKVFSKKMLKELGIDEKLRPQHIEVKNWIKLYEKAEINFPK